MLFFYPKDETSVCTKEACAFRDQFQVFKDLGAEVIGVSSDSEQSHKGFAEHHKLPYTLLSDEGGVITLMFVHQIVGVRSACSGFTPHAQNFNLNYEELACSDKG